MYFTEALFDYTYIAMSYLYTILFHFFHTILMLSHNNNNNFKRDVTHKAFIHTQNVKKVHIYRRNLQQHLLYSPLWKWWWWGSTSFSTQLNSSVQRHVAHVGRPFYYTHIYIFCSLLHNEKSYMWWRRAIKIKLEHACCVMFIGPLVLRHIRAILYSSTELVLDKKKKKSRKALRWDI